MESLQNMSPAVLANVRILMTTSQDVGWKLMLHVAQYYLNGY